MMKTLLFVAAAVMLASANKEIKRAIVRLEGNGVTGNVTFTQQQDDIVRITGTITGMAPGMYGFHVHQTGDITNGCGSTQGHFNPNGNDHGHPHDENRHAGDLGNIEFDDSRTANIDFLDHIIKLEGCHSIIGRGLVLHERADDFGRSKHPDSKKTGNAGGRVACGVIGILEEAPAKANSASISTGNIFILMCIYAFIAVLLR